MAEGRVHHPIWLCIQTFLHRGGRSSRRGNLSIFYQVLIPQSQFVLQSKRFSGPNQGPSIQFTGPINVKVTKETRELKQEQYDLDTGEIRTWVETEEYEVVDLTEDTPVRVARTGSITHHVDLTEEVEEPTVELERKPLADLRNRLGISHLPVIIGSKFSNSTSNLSLDISSIRSLLRSTSTPLLSKSGMENETFDESNVSSTFGSSLLLGESPSKRHKLSNSTSDVSLNESSVGSWDLELVRSRLLSVGTKVEGIRRRRRNSLRV